MIETAGDKTSEVIVEMLKSTDKPIQTVAIATLKEVAKTDVIKAAAEQMANLEAAQQGKLVFALADCGDKERCRRFWRQQRTARIWRLIAALKAVGTLGDARLLICLSRRRSSRGGEEQKPRRRVCIGCAVLTLTTRF